MPNATPQIFSLQYVSRGELGDTAPFSKADLPLLVDLRRHIAEAGCLDRFGVSLRTLQRAIGEGETTLEESDEESRTSFTEVLPIDSDRLAGSRPTNWSFSRSDEISAGNCPGYCDYKDWKHTNRHKGRFHALAAEPEKTRAAPGAVALEDWCAPGDVSRLSAIDDVPMIRSSDTNLLSSIRSTVLSFGQDARIGVVLLHKHFDVRSGEVLVERCLTEPRLSIVKSLPAAALPADVVPSVLRFAA
jgi:hypothetical protein